MADSKHMPTLPESLRVLEAVTNALDEVHAELAEGGVTRVKLARVIAVQDAKKFLSRARASASEGG